MDKLNKDIWDAYLKNKHTLLVEINLDCHFDTDNEHMNDMFYKDIEVLFYYNPGEDPDFYSPGEYDSVEVAAVHNPDTNSYFVRKDFDPKVLNWIENHLLEEIHAF